MNIGNEFITEDVLLNRLLHVAHVVVKQVNGQRTFATTKDAVQLLNTVVQDFERFRENKGNERIRELLKMMPAQNQRRDSANDQVRDLYAVAVHLGMYDAADLIKVTVDKPQ